MSEITVKRNKSNKLLVIDEDHVIVVPEEVVVLQKRSHQYGELGAEEYTLEMDTGKNCYSIDYGTDKGKRDEIFRTLLDLITQGTEG